MYCLRLVVHIRVQTLIAFKREHCAHTDHCFTSITCQNVIRAVTAHVFNMRLSLQVLSALDILQPPSLDFFQEMYPFIIR